MFQKYKKCIRCDEVKVANGWCESCGFNYDNQEEISMKDMKNGKMNRTLSLILDMDIDLSKDQWKKLIGEVSKDEIAIASRIEQVADCVAKAGEEAKDDLRSLEATIETSMDSLESRLDGLEFKCEKIANAQAQGRTYGENLVSKIDTLISLFDKKPTDTEPQNLEVDTTALFKKDSNLFLKNVTFEKTHPRICGYNIRRVGLTFDELKIASEECNSNGITDSTVAYAMVKKISVGECFSYDNFCENLTRFAGRKDRFASRLHSVFFLIWKNTDYKIIRIVNRRSIKAFMRIE